jgi:hypothetical protein
MNEIVIRQSAYKHGFSRYDILSVYSNPVTSRIIDNDFAKWLYVGFSSMGIPMEVIAKHSHITEIIHAMKLRKTFEKLIGRR